MGVGLVIPTLLRDFRYRLVILALVAVVLYFLEPAFHQHGEVDPEFVAELGPRGISATLAYFAGLSMIVLLAGFVSTDRKEGYASLFFSHPTSPLAYYGLKWLLAVLISMLAAGAFLVVGQLLAWGGYRGGASGLLLALLSALVYGALMAFFSCALRRGDAWVVFVLFIPTFFPQMLTLLEFTMGRGAYDALIFVMPPQGALQDVYQGLLLGGVGSVPILFVVGYAAVWLGGAMLLLQLREMP
jgi:hypothetical protein